MNPLLSVIICASLGVNVMYAKDEPASTADAAPSVLWQIGQADGGNAEFALAPKDYRSYKDDGVFVVGSSDSKLDWPYVHPGPSDGWAGGCEHNFKVVFGLKDKPSAGNCRLRLDLLDTHSKAPPRLRIDVNGSPFVYTLPAGGGDASVNGDLAQGKPTCSVIEFPSALLKAGRNDMTIVNTSGSWFLYDAVTLEAPVAVVLAPLADAAAIVAKARGRSVKVTDIWVVFKTHFDLGFTDRAEDVFKKYRETMMDGALKVIEQSRSQPKEKQFTWTVAGWPLEAQILGPLQEPARRKRIEQALKEGTLAVHALPFTTHTESLDCEDLVRGLSYSSQVARRYGLPLPVAAKMTDVPSHSWIMPTLLKHAGVKFLHIGCNAASQYPRFPSIFWWEGPDGSRLLCGYTVDYGSGIRPPKDWPAKNYLAMIMTGDNHGPPSPSEVETILKEAEQKLPGINVHFGTLDDFANALEKENPKLPIVRGDTPDTWIHGLMSMPQTSQLARNIRPLEPALETLDTQLNLWGLKTEALAQPLAEAYENSLLYGEHTWGMNAEFGPRTVYGEAWKKWLAAAEAEPAKKKWLRSYEDHRDYIRRTAAIVNKELTARLDLLAKNVKSDGNSVVVFNALPWKRSGVVVVPGKSGVFVFAGEVPANGYKVVSVAEAKPDKLVREAAPNVIETAFFKTTFDLQRGGIASLIDKKSGRELVDTTSPYAVGQFLHERFSTKEVFDRFFSKYARIQGGWGLNDIGKPGMPDAEKSPYWAVTPDNWKLEAAHGDAVDTVTLTGCDTKGLAKAYTLRFTFNRFEAHVEVEWTVDVKTADKTPEGGWLCFPFAVADPLFTVGRLGGPVNPATDIVPGANRHLMAVTSGVAMTSPEKSGVALCPIDSPLVSLDRPGLWWWTLDFVPKKATVFVNLYNNMWNTNFPLWQEGSWSNRVRFWPLLNEKASESLAVLSMEARLPLLAASANSTAGKLPTTSTGLTLSRKGVLVTAFGIDPDGNPGTLLRVWEQAGVAGALEVTLPTLFKTAQPVTLRGEKKGEAIAVKTGRFSFHLGAYAPMSYILE